MLKIMWNARWYWVIGTLVFLCALILLTPLHFIWRFVEPKVQGLPVQISQLQGTLWQGEAQLQSPELAETGPLSARWTLSPWPLFMGQAKLALVLENEHLRLSGPLSLSSSGAKLEGLEGYLDLALLAPVLRPQQSSVQGSVELHALHATLQFAPPLVSAVSGKLQYSGGDISLLVDRKPVSATLPMLLGDLSMQGDKAQLELTTLDAQSVLSGYLQSDGWTGVALKRRFIDLLGQTWPVKADADSVIFEVSHKLY